MAAIAPTLQQELAAFYARHGFGSVVGERPRTVGVYTGCLLVPMPNIETRRRFLKYHDLHHLVTGYGVGRIGEGEMSAWELGTGSLLSSPLLAMMNLIALSTGLVLQPRRMWRAFVRGTRSRNLYPESMRCRIDAGEWRDVAQLREELLDVRKPARPLAAFRAVEFAGYAFVAMLVHACIAIPALIARFATDLAQGQGFVEAIRPKPRQDLF